VTAAGAFEYTVGDMVTELAQHYPQPGWVEHDAEEIWQADSAGPLMDRMIRVPDQAGPSVWIGIVQSLPERVDLLDDLGQPGNTGRVAEGREGGRHRPRRRLLDASGDEPRDAARDSGSP